MIPKKIHYCWFSGDPFPPEVQKCMDSWRRYMPDFELVLWDADKVSYIESMWLSECLKEKKWAFASDFVRLYALYHEGGVYLDTDVETFKSFSTLLDQKAFIGREWTWHNERFCSQQYLTSHCMGAEAGNAFIGRCLRYYDHRHFILSDDTSLPHPLRYNQMLLPQIQCELAMQEGYQSGLHADSSIVALADIMIYPSHYFDPHKVRTQSYCRHLCLGGWLSSSSSDTEITFIYRVKYRLDLWLKLLISKVWHC